MVFRKIGHGKNIMRIERVDLIKEHISTHSKSSATDRRAVTALESFFSKSGGRINTDFSHDDKWPNHDGFFEFVRDTDLCRIPEQKFVVQIKGTERISEKNGYIAFKLKELNFPAFIADTVTADPGILFFVFLSNDWGVERFFWKYMSPGFIDSIDFNKSSITIKFHPDEEIKTTEQGLDDFCRKLIKIEETHLFLNKLNKDRIDKKNALEIVKYVSGQITDNITAINEADNESEKRSLREVKSRQIVRDLYSLVYAILILNAFRLGCNDVNIKVAWEVSRHDRETKYLCDFLNGLIYIGIRIPSLDQSERLMLKYYSYLWESRKFLKEKFDIPIIPNLESFPLNMDILDNEYYEIVVESIKKTKIVPSAVRLSRYYVQKQIPFVCNGELYYEITLQLAGLYASKYNRITVFSKKQIQTYYSVQISYSNTNIELWGIKSEIKILNNWKVSIAPSSLNKIGKMLRKKTSISSKYREYNALMDYLTSTGFNLYEIINLDDYNFLDAHHSIYYKSNTHFFGDVLREIRDKYSKKSKAEGRFTIGYALLSMREELLEGMMPNYSRCLTDDLYISNKCFPFEKNPFISNLPGTKNSKSDLQKIMELVNDKERFELTAPYVRLDRLMKKTGELYFDLRAVGELKEIDRYNASLDKWERSNGFLINEENGVVSIDSHEKATIFILHKLVVMSNYQKSDRRYANAQYLKEYGNEINDPLKHKALKKAFINSRVLLIYGAAGTGKTTLIKYLSDMLRNSSQLFLAKTHTALQNLKRRIDNSNYEFKSIDSVARGNSLVEHGVVFIDECSIIDNRTMMMLMKKLNSNTRLVLSGDIYQIESIEFGNWFYYAKDIVKSSESVVELFHNWRTEKEELKSLWDEVRELKPIITEKLSMDGPFSENLGEGIFQPSDKDEIVLCLNYDGKFGLNNLNTYFQNANTAGEPVKWAEWTYKVGDKILFIDNHISSLLYNNLKGQIIKIEKEKKKISFTLDIFARYSYNQCRYEKFKYVNTYPDKTRIIIEVIEWDDELSDEDKIYTVVPFQISYAVSIHKAQGLEYNSVKIVIPSGNAEKISHSVFYTAITRAKEKLKIFWSPETMKTVVENFYRDEREYKSLPIIEKKINGMMQ